MISVIVFRNYWRRHFVDEVGIHEFKPKSGNTAPDLLNDISIKHDFVFFANLVTNVREALGKKS
jgi:hypothetical protein